ncbi:MAG: hypothetical protein HOP28_17985 [Gemmatimonadales bacterium]|nr:hypothetical protein [Gemmatimonadales bacterium]
MLRHLPFLAIAAMIPISLSLPTRQNSALPKLRLTSHLKNDALANMKEITDADIGADGMIVVLAGKDPAVVLFDPSGNLRLTISAIGSGPGELRTPTDVEVGPQGEIAVLDPGANRIQIWNRNGALLGQVTGTTPFEPWLEWNVSGLYAKTSTGAEVSALVRIDTKKFAVGARVGLVPVRIAGTANGGSCKYCAIALSPTGRIVLASPDTAYQIFSVDKDGSLKAYAGRSDVGAVPLGAEEYEALSRRVKEANAMMAGTGRSVTLPAPNRFQRRVLSRGMTFDERGQLWVQPYGIGIQRGSFDVFGVSGQFLGRIALRRNLTMLQLRGTVLIAVEESNGGDKTLTVFQVTF